MSDEEKIVGIPNEIRLHGVDFKCRPGESTYHARPTDDVRFQLKAEDRGIWCCTITAGAIHKRAHNTLVMNGNVTAMGCSIDIANAVELALSCLSKLTMSIAACGNQLGLTVTPEEEAADDDDD